jgi:hypothetical protein
MKTYIPINNGLGENSDGNSVTELLSALSEDQYRRLVGFTRLQLRATANTRWLNQCLAIIDGEDLVHEAILKLYLGEHDPSLGRHLKPRNCASMDSFLACVKGVISSDLYNLVHEARNRIQQQFIGDSEIEEGAVEPIDPIDAHDLLSRRDLHRVFFKKLYKRIENQPSLLSVVRDWEERALDDDRIGRAGMNRLNRDLVCRVRQLAREIISDLAGDITPAHDEGKEMSL